MPGAGPAPAPQVHALPQPQSEHAVQARQALISIAHKVLGRKK